MAIKYLGGGMVEGILGTVIPASTDWTIASGFTFTSGTGIVVNTSSNSYGTYYDLGTTVSCTDGMVIDYDLTRTSGDYYDHPMLKLQNTLMAHGDVSSNGDSKIMLLYWANGNTGDSAGGAVANAQFYASGSMTELSLGDSTNGYRQPADGTTRYYRFYVGKTTDSDRQVRWSAWDSDANRTAEGSSGREFNDVHGTALGTGWSSSDDLRYLVVENKNSNQANWTLSNLKIWNVASTGVANNLLNDTPTKSFDFTDVPAVDEKATITNIPIGTRWHETDTRKIFYYGNNGLKSSSPTWFEKSSPSGAVGHTYTRGVFGGGYSVTNIMEYITIDTTGNVTDFGDLTVARKLLSGLSSTTRGCFGGGEPVSMTDIIDYITILTTGNAVDFGDLTYARANSPAPASSATRGLWMGGYASAGNSDIIDYITIATPSNATDFGNLTQARNTAGGLSDDTRACCFGGLVSAYYNIIDYVTIATTGNATDFGDIVTARYGMSGGEDGTRGIMAGGKVNTTSTWYDTIEYITIQTLGNATDFGNLSSNRAFGTMCSGNTRAVWAGGNESGGNTNVMEYITIQTTGNVTDFGDLSTIRGDLGACEG